MNRPRQFLALPGTAARLLSAVCLVVFGLAGSALAQDGEVLPTGGDLSLGSGITNELSLLDIELTLGPEQKMIRKRALESQAEAAAMNFLKRNDYAKAIEAYQALGDLVGKPVNQLGLAMAEMGDGRYADAETRFLWLLEQEPRQPIYLNNLAWLYVSARDVRVRNADKGLRYARRALLETPRDPRIWNTLSQGYYLQEKYLDARQRSKQAVLLMQHRAEFGETVRLDIETQFRKCENAARSAQ